MSLVLAGLDVAGDADAWRAAGFTVDDNSAIRAGHLRIQTGVGAKGIAAWTLADAPVVDPDEHANGTTLLDHLVVFTDDVERTTAAYAALGLDRARHTRELGNGTAQVFFRAGEVIIELVGPIADVTGERFSGTALTVRVHLDMCVRGSVSTSVRSSMRCNPVDALQLCTTAMIGLTVPDAFMSE